MTTTTESPNRRWMGIAVKCVIAAVVIGGFAAGALTQQRWLPQVKAFLAVSGDDDHDAHDDQGQGNANSVELSPQAIKNVGLTTALIKLQSFSRTASVPAIVVGRPGRSEIEVTAPLGGRITRVYAIEGEAVDPGQPLFDLRLTHEELVRAQSEFLRSAAELDVEQREIERLKSVPVPGAILGKRLLEREYERDKIKAVLSAQMQSLLLHGLTREHVDEILETRTLVQGLTVVAPQPHQNGAAHSQVQPLTLRKLHVALGQYADTGEPLCQLMDYTTLYIQGRAFEHDAEDLARPAREGWEITASPEGSQQEQDVIKGLTIVYVDNDIDLQSRALHFYVALPNEVVRDRPTADGRRFLSWRYRVGQRMQLQIPVEQWEDRIVLPTDAVAKEGAEYYVFEQNGPHFDRKSVHVEYRDQFWVVIANDGSVYVGDTVVTSGAHQLQMELKNNAAGPIDPHAGHNH